jgi:adenylate cyclase
MAAHALSQLTDEIDHARAVMQQSIQLNPSSASAWSSSCYMHTLFGEYETAIDHFHHSQRLNPLDQIHHVHWNMAGMAYFGAERYEEADAAADKALSVRPTYPQALRLKIATSGMLGRSDVGRANVQRLLAVHPDCDVRWLEEFNGPMLKNAPKLLRTYITAARNGGMPERARQIVRGSSKLQ